MHINGSPLVKLLVRRPDSNKFLRATGRWTKKTSAALNFRSLVSALHFCRAKGLKNVQLILRFKGDRDDHCYPFEGA